MNEFAMAHPIITLIVILAALTTIASVAHSFGRQQ